MANFLNQSREPREGQIELALAHENPVPDHSMLSRLATGWRGFLQGPKLPPGPAIAVLAAICLLLWAGFVGLAALLFRA